MTRTLPALGPRRAAEVIAALVEAETTHVSIEPVRGGVRVHSGDGPGERVAFARYPTVARLQTAADEVRDRARTAREARRRPKMTREGNSKAS